MKDLPLITVITPCFNSIRTLRETLESVRSQAYPCVEHIVMDGGSTDGTLDVLKQYPEVIWFSEKDEGHYDAMNKGILRATGSVVGILNADDCYRPGALLAVGRAFQQHPEWDGLFGDVVVVDGQGREIYRREEADFDYDLLRFCGVDYVVHQTLFVKKTVHDRLGLYRHEHFLNACDFDFILRLGKAQCRIGHVNALLVNYRYHDFGQSADLRVIANMVRECDRLRQEHGLPEGWTGRLWKLAYRCKRQWRKLRCRGKCDLIPATWLLKKHMRQKTTFSSNIGLDKL
jgi:glycosyltransferase involved in cell wall biosynthesis